MVESLMSCLACLFAFLASSLLFAVGLSVWMALHRLMPLPLTLGDTGRLSLEGAATPVMSAFMQSQVIPRSLLTSAAATHWPRFLKPEQACCAGWAVRV